MPLISVILPIYYVEKYLDRCIDNNLNQSFSCFDLVLIDDGSSDRCGDICEEFVEKDSRVILIHKKMAVYPMREM